MSATVSKFVEINSGGAVTLTGNSGGGVTTDGVTNSPLAVSINLGELGPSNTNSFVTAQVPLKLRSNAAYVLSMAATVTSSGATASRIGLLTWASVSEQSRERALALTEWRRHKRHFRRSDSRRERICKRNHRPL